MSTAKGKGKNGKGPSSTSAGLGKDGKQTKDSKPAAVDPDLNDWNKKRHEALELLAGVQFDMFIGGVILLNAVTIGIEQTLSINNQSTLGVRIVESIFLVIYIVELGLRFFALGCVCLRDKWVKLDVMLVSLGVLNSWIFEPAMSEAPHEMSMIMLLRTCRLMRLAKTARLLARIRDFWMLIRGLMTSISMMAYIFAVLGVVLYCFTSLGIELITKHSLNENDPEFRLHVDTYFASIPKTMLTLVQFVTMDDLATIYRPLCEKDPWLTLYFIALILVVSVLTMNLVLAITLSTTLDSNQRELDAKQSSQESDWGSFIANLKDMFNRLDEDKSGQLSLEEFLEVDIKDQQLLCQALELNTPQEIFKQLDNEKTGEVCINKFFDCILDKVLTHGDVSLKRTERQVETMHWRLKETFAAQNELTQSMKRMTLDVKRMWMILHGDAEAAALADPESRKNGHMNGLSLKVPGDGTESRGDQKQARRSAGGDGFSRQFSLDRQITPFVAAEGAPPRNVSFTGGKSAGVLPQVIDPEMACWETDIAGKVRSLVDEGLQFAFERLRKVADAAKEDAARKASQKGRGDGQAKAAATKAAAAAAAAASARKSSQSTSSTAASPRSKASSSNADVLQLPTGQARSVPPLPQGSKSRLETDPITHPATAGESPPERL